MTIKYNFFGLASLNEEKLSSNERENLDKNDFGFVDSDGKGHYPLNDENHVRSAITQFNKCPEKYKSVLRKNILKKAKKYGITINSKEIINEDYQEENSYDGNLSRIRNYIKDTYNYDIRDFDYPGNSGKSKELFDKYNGYTFLGSFNFKELIDGIKEESEHFDNIEMRIKIAADHLTEDPNYYSKLKSVMSSDESEENEVGNHWKADLDFFAEDINEFNFFDGTDDEEPLTEAIIDLTNNTSSDPIIEKYVSNIADDEDLEELEIFDDEDLPENFEESYTNFF
jgi:hypothetical protein